MPNRLDVDPVAVTGEWIRHSPHNSELLGRSPEATDGRWQLGETVRGLYLAQDAETAIAEWYRLLAELGIPPAHRIPHDHHLWRVDLQLADLTTPERLHRVDLALPQPARRTWPPYQAVGNRLAAAGWAGLLAPSAARPDARIICIFDHGSWPPAGSQPVSRYEVAEAPPPPTGMVT